VGGLDPSLSNFGMVKGSFDGATFIPEDIKLVTTREDASLQYQNQRDLKRAIQLREAMLQFFDGIDTIYVEMPVGSQSARASVSYGVCIGILTSLGKRLVRVSARDVKLIATDDPKASKQAMINWAYNKYPSLPWLTKMRNGTKSLTNANEHVSDAIGAVLAGLKNEQEIVWN